MPTGRAARSTTLSVLDLAGLVAQAAGRTVRRARPVGGAAPDLRARAAIEAFVAQEYWTVEAELGKADGRNFNARLTHLNGKKLGKLDITSEAEAFAAAAAIEAEGPRSSTFRPSAFAKIRNRLHHINTAAGSIPQARLFGQPHHADRPEAL